jgi:hypothetical protein
MKPRNKKLAPFVPLTRDTLKTAAWRALSHPARSLYVALKGRYNRNLQNSVYLSTRVAAKEMGSSKNYMPRWFRELEHYGFIVMVSPGHLGVEGMGKAPHWRLTEEWYAGKAPTRDYLNWGGEKFHEQKSPRYYLRKKQNPVPQLRDTAPHKCGTVGSRNGAPARESVPQLGDIKKRQPVPQLRDITSLTTPLAALSLLAAHRQRLNDLSARLAVFAPIRVALPETELGETERL